MGGLQGITIMVHGEWETTVHDKMFGSVKDDSRRHHTVAYMQWSQSLHAQKV